MNTYTNVFGGDNVNPADLSYKFYRLTSNIQLDWPFEALDGALIVADKIDVQADAGHTITMPDATLVSVGEDVLWNNVGASAFTVYKYDGSALLTVQPGTQWFTYLTDNSTQAGIWRTTQFGASTSTANASALAGAGLRAGSTGLLDQNLITSNSLLGNQSLTATSRARVFRNTGGNAVHTIDPAASLGAPPMSANGWFVVEINGGSGNVDITPTAPDLIDGVASVRLAPGESCTVYCYGSGFATMGHGRQISSTVAGVSIDASAGTGDIVLSNAQIAAQVQDFTGTLTANRNVIYGEVTGYWFIYNHTNGAFTLTFKGGAADTTPFTVPQNSFVVLRSQGGQLDIAFTLGLGSVTSISTVHGEITGGDPTPITSIGTIGLSDILGGTLVPGSYPTLPGGATSSPKVPQVTVDAKGRVTHGAEYPIAITALSLVDLGFLIPSGTMLAFAGITMPPAPPAQPYWLPCDGTTRLRAAFPNLFTAISTTYNTGGELGTEFRLPDTRGRVLAGADAGIGRLGTSGLGVAAILGAVGGQQTEAANINIPQLFVRTGYWASPVQSSTAGALVSIGGTTGGPSAPFQSIQDGSGTGVATSGHTHDWAGTGSIAWDSTLFGAYGLTDAATNTAATGFTGTTTVTNVQPTLIIRHIIKT